MKVVNEILIVVLYILLLTSLTLYIVDLLVFIETFSEVKSLLGGHIFDTIFYTFLGISIVIYLSLTINSYVQVGKTNEFNDTEISFWRKLLILKPISGIVAFYFRNKANVFLRRISLLIKLSYYLRNISFFVAIISIFIVFLSKKSNVTFFVSAFMGIYIAIIMHFLFEPLIFIDAWQRDKKEWKEFNYYRYFTSIKSILGYGEYFKRHFRQKLKIIR